MDRLRHGLFVSFLYIKRIQRPSNRSSGCNGCVCSLAAEAELYSANRCGSGSKSGPQGTAALRWANEDLQKNKERGVLAPLWCSARGEVRDELLRLCLEAAPTSDGLELPARREEVIVQARGLENLNEVLFGRTAPLRCRVREARREEHVEDVEPLRVVQVLIVLLVVPGLWADLGDRLPVRGQHVRDPLRRPAVEQVDDRAERGPHGGLVQVPSRRLVARRFGVRDEEALVRRFDPAVPRTPG